MRYRANQNWGNTLWAFIHTITIIDYEVNEMYNNTIKKTLFSLQETFPCQACRLHYIERLKLIDNMDLSKPMVLFYWSVDLHNAVNKKLGKPEWTYEMALEKWGHQVSG
jgi:hypothetical protein